MVYIIATLFSAVVAWQGDKTNDIDINKNVKELGSDDISIREAAEMNLKSMPENRIPEMREKIRITNDTEVTMRLKGVIKHILIRESERLYRECKVKGSLLKRAEALEAEDTELYVKREFKKVKAYIYEITRANNAIERSHQYMPNILEKIRSFRPWGIPAIVDLLGEEETIVVRIMIILLEYSNNEEVVPPLIEALGKKDDNIKIRSCKILGSIKSCDAIEPLKKLYSDKSASDGVRAAAKNAIISIDGKAPD